jgi:hypothetical protein
MAKYLFKSYRRAAMARSEEPVTMMSSTYIRRNIVIPDLLKRNNEVLAFDGI